MTTIFGHLNLSDSEYVFNATVGQQVIFEAATAYVNRVNAELNAALSIFVAGVTEDYKRRYQLPAEGGSLGKRGSDGRYPAVKASGYWDVAFPLEDYGNQVVGNDVDMAYMTVAELDRHLQTVMSNNRNSLRSAILHKLFDNVADTFVDPRWGSLTIQPLANGDTVVYPPVIGSTTEATRDRYAESGYADSAVSDTNDPFETIIAALEADFGQPTGGSNIATFVNSADVAYYSALTDFYPVISYRIQPGGNTDLPRNIPPQLSQIGRVIGYHKSGSWVVQWDWVPDNYLLGIHLDIEPPLMKRVDPATTGLGSDLQLVSTDQDFPFQGSHWRHRFGFGAANRLNGYVMELGTGGTYTVPTAYT